MKTKILREIITGKNDDIRLFIQINHYDFNFDYLVAISPIKTDKFLFYRYVSNYKQAKRIFIQKKKQLEICKKTTKTILTLGGIAGVGKINKIQKKDGK